MIAGGLGRQIKFYSTNTVRRSLPFALFLLRDLLRSAPLLRSYRIRLSGLYWISSELRLSAPERVPPLSIKAIKLSKPLMEHSPAKFHLQKQRPSLFESSIWKELNEKLYPHRSNFKLIFFRPDSAPFPMHTSRP
jgi:hypothetical protein